MGVIIDKTKRSGNSDIDSYINELETELTSFELVHLKKLILSCDEISGVLASDILIALGKKEGTAKVLNDDKSDMLLDRLLKIIDKVEAFRKVNDTAKTLMPLIKEEGKVKELDTSAESVQELTIPIVERLPRRQI